MVKHSGEIILYIYMYILALFLYSSINVWFWSLSKDAGLGGL